MLVWYADNSELNAGYGAEIPDLLMFGGIALAADTTVALRKKLDEIKSNYSDGFPFPLKWNFKDLRRYFEKKDAIELYDDLLPKSKEIRQDVFGALQSFDITIILSCLVAYSNKRNVLKKMKASLASHVFANGLMRFALHVRDVGADHAEVVLDWPDANDSSPFDDEYASAYYKGKTASDDLNYISGPLSNLGFSDSPFYARMVASSLLQVSDLVVGASKDFVEVALGKKKEAVGVQFLRTVASKLRGAPDSIMGYGINVSPSRSDLRDKIENGIQQLLF